jgi:hypothetical protein
MSLEAFIGNGKVVAGIVTFSVTVAAGGITSYYTVSNRLERVAEIASQAAVSARDASAAAAAARDFSIQQIKEHDAEDNIRINALEAARVATDRRVDVMEEKMRAIGETIGRVDRRQEVLLDRLNAPRTRIVRDIP